MVAALNLDVSKKLVDAYLRQILSERQASAGDVGSRYEVFWQRITTVLMSGGKRIRPHLTMIGYGEIDERLVPIAAAQELLHVAMLMHDDIIDQDDVRHGNDNMNGLYKNDYGEYVDESRSQHYAYGAGMLAGDLLISEAYRAIHTSDFDDSVKHRVVDQMHESIYEVVGGELLDVEAPFVTDVDFDCLKIYRYKTSSYSFIGPLLSGAYCAEADEHTLNLLTKFAEAIGIAFQVQDDVLGVFGDESKLGKTTLTDLRDGKRTLLATYHEKAMSDEARDRFQYFGRQDATKAQLERIKQDMIESGALNNANQAVARYIAVAKQSLASLKNHTQRQSLETLINTISKRES